MLTDDFASVFGDLFDTVEFSPPSPVDLESLIDRIEEIDDERVSLSYDRNVTHCEISIAGTDATLYITSESFRIIHPEPQTTRVLINSLFEVQNALVDFSSLNEPEAEN